MIAEFQTGSGPDDVITHILMIQEFGRLYYCMCNDESEQRYACHLTRPLRSLLLGCNLTESIDVGEL